MDKIIIKFIEKYYELDKYLSTMFYKGYINVEKIYKNGTFFNIHIITLSNVFGETVTSWGKKVYPPFKNKELRDEEIILKHLSLIYSLFTELDKQHLEELNDFVDGIHKCQYVIGMRYARKHRPDLFPKK